MPKLSKWFVANKLSTDKTCYMIFPPDTSNSTKVYIKGHVDILVYILTRSLNGLTILTMSIISYLNTLAILQTQR